ncbi:hypothetical protein PYK79_50070 [Streptomyces sp. ID05-04B]|uniref:hypothetical protein n=1 Tax=Streptomyces sp. ID05-04B TaxID=3028661 RepID=UPI0029C5ECA1|nr:hypothetical protein [Streptomyces sp. ID05-04B]MDX5569828.1 hypothetical protein [Streptomyces sp. ID05-04B]
MSPHQRTAYTSRALAVLELAAATWLAARGHWWTAVLVTFTAPSLLVVGAGACATHHRARAEARREAQLQRGEPPALLVPCCSFWKNSDGQVHRPGCDRLGEEQHVRDGRPLDEAEAAAFTAIADRFDHGSRT